MAEVASLQSNRIDAVPTHNLNTLVTNLGMYGEMLVRGRQVTQDRLTALLGNPHAEGHEQELLDLAGYVNGLFPNSVADIE